MSRIGGTEIHTSFYCVDPLRFLLGEYNNYCTVSVPSKVGRPGNMATYVEGYTAIYAGL